MFDVCIRFLIILDDLYTESQVVRSGPRSIYRQKYCRNNVKNKYLISKKVLY